jgi:Fe-S oxidoreductase
LTSPGIYNTIRHKKTRQLREEAAQSEPGQLILVSCPSCKMGLMRIIQDEKLELKVLHVLEYLALLLGGPAWPEELQAMLRHSRLQDQAVAEP